MFKLFGSHFRPSPPSPLARGQAIYQLLVVQHQFRCLHEINDRREEKLLLNFTELKNRKVIKVHGTDAFRYIQVFTTNNLQQHRNCYASFITNVASKILCDLLIYKIKGDVFDKELVLDGLTKNTFGKRLVECLEEDDDLRESNRELIEQLKQYARRDEEEVLYLECDAQLAESVRKTLITRRIEEQVDFEILDDLRVYSMFSSVVEEHAPSDKFVLKDEYISRYFCLVNDPRLPHLGQRVITSLPEKGIKVFLSSLFDQIELKDATMRDYRLNRYKLGIGEGLQDHLMKETFVNSFNGDLLGAISLYKGGFTGWLPTNRITKRQTHNKYLKRLLPFEFINPSNRKLVNFPTGVDFMSTQHEKVIGQLIGNVGNYGIGYFDLQPFVHVENYREIKARLSYERMPLEAIVRIPFWWPKIENRNFLTFVEHLHDFKIQQLNEAEEKERLQLESGFINRNE